MLSLSEKDRSLLLLLRDSVSKIRDFTADISDADSFFADKKTFDAVLMNFVVIGETSSRLSDAFKNSASHVPWSRIKSFRNIVAHDYFGVDAEAVWEIIQNHLPPLDGDIEDILQS
jgi:uncharacterized protein with HEPN domain